MVYQIVCFWYVIFIISSCTSFYFTHNVFSFIFFPFIQYFIYADIPFRYIHLGGQFLSDLSPTRKRVTVCARVTRVWEDQLMHLDIVFINEHVCSIHTVYSTECCYIGELPQ